METGDLVIILAVTGTAIAALGVVLTVRYGRRKRTIDHGGLILKKCQPVIQPWRRVKITTVRRSGGTQETIEELKIGRRKYHYVGGNRVDVQELD